MRLEPLASVHVPASRDGCRALLRFARRSSHTAWAIEHGLWAAIASSTAPRRHNRHRRPTAADPTTWSGATPTMHPSDIQVTDLTCHQPKCTHSQRSTPATLNATGSTPTRSRVKSHTPMSHLRTAPHGHADPKILSMAPTGLRYGLSPESTKSWAYSLTTQ